VRRCVWSRNLVNDVIARIRPQRHMKKIIFWVSLSLYVVTATDLRLPKQFLDKFAKSRPSPLPLLKPSVLLSICTSADPSGWLLVKFHTGNFYEILHRKPQIVLKSHGNIGSLHEVVLLLLAILNRYKSFHFKWNWTRWLDKLSLYPYSYLSICLSVSTYRHISNWKDLLEIWDSKFPWKIFFQDFLLWLK